MQQVLFRIPGVDWPIYGFGFMLFVAFIFCVWLAARLAKKEGIDPKHVQDLALWIFVFGIVGARITWLHAENRPWADFFMIWEGGLVFYGSAVGGTIGYLLGYWFVLRKHNISSWKMADILAPCIALGLCIGRLGCLLNGCCYGGACSPDDWKGITFPLASPPRYTLVEKGWQTAAGFTLYADASRAVVKSVDPDSAAARAGLEVGDTIVNVHGNVIDASRDLDEVFVKYWPRGVNHLQVTVARRGQPNQTLTFAPRTIPIQPTQIYETISMGLLFFLLLAYMPFKKRDGSVMVLLMVCYAIHRYFNEMLRNDTKPVLADFTLSQVGSFIVLIGALLLAVIIYLRKPKGPVLAT